MRDDQSFRGDLHYLLVTRLVASSAHPATHQNTGIDSPVSLLSNCPAAFLSGMRLVTIEATARFRCLAGPPLPPQAPLASKQGTMQIGTDFITHQLQFSGAGQDLPQAPLGSEQGTT